MLHKSLLALASAAVLGGCAGAVHQLPQLDQTKLAMAQGEVAAGAGEPQRHAVSDDEVRAVVASAVARIRPAADQVCREVAVGTCQWRIAVVSDRSLNASAGSDGLIAVNRGIAEYADNEDQVAMVIAHELGHQMANHLVTAQRNQMIGKLIGAALLGVAGAAAASHSPYRTDVTLSAMQAGSQIGGAIGRISFSKEQEREADYLAALILYLSGLGLDKARGFLVIMARGSGHRETGMLDSHPAGPERLAAWDKAVEEVRASNSALPQRK